MELSSLEYMASAWTAKFTAVCMTYPHEVIRTRMRQPPEPGGEPKYRRFVPSLRLIVREEGWTALYGGLGAHLLRVTPNAVLLFLTYELFVRYFALEGT